MRKDIGKYQPQERWSNYTNVRQNKVQAKKSLKKRHIL